MPEMEKKHVENIKMAKFEALSIKSEILQQFEFFKKTKKIS